ncbi:MAG: tetratricopeptide repeat protein, partial [Elusimicrobia bacterium]|nr:tetratricopeptide repeat protein [Elusimicrobiota bacterium]
SARGRLSGRGWAWVAGLFALGTAVFLFLPVRAWGDPWLDWGDPKTPARLWRVLTRGDYGGVRLHPERPAGLGDPALWRSGLLYAASVFRAELSGAGAALALWGVWSGRRSRAVQGLSAAFLLAGPVFIVWANLDPSRPESRPILEPHLVLPLVCAAVLAGAGAADLLGRLPRRAAAVLGAALAASALWSRRADASALGGHRGDFSAWDYGTALAAGLPRGALVLDPDDPTAFTLSYLKAAHGKAAELTPLLYFRTRWGYEYLKRRSPELLPEREIRSGLELLDALISHNLAAGRPLFADLPQKAPPGTPVLPEGLAYRLRSTAPDAAARAAAFVRAETAFRVLLVRPARGDAGFFSRHAAAYWSSGLNNAAIEAEHLGRGSQAERLYASALAFDPDLAQAWNNWANAALQRGDTAAAEGRYKASLRTKDDAAVRYNLGRAYLMAGRLEDAERTYKESVAAGGPLEASNDLGLVYLRAGRLEEAVRQWGELLRRRPDYALAYYNLGVAFEKLGRRREAAQAARAWGSLSSSPADRAEAAAWLRRLEN